MAQAGQGLAEDAGFGAREVPSGGLENAEREARRYFPGQVRDEWQRVLEAMPANGLGPVSRLGYLRGSPACARALGPEAAIRLGETGMALAQGAGEQAALALFMQAPKAARILGAVAPFRSWLRILESMAPRAPESMLAVLARMEGLLERLDVRALEAWILGGIRSAGGDPASRQRYFGFADPRAEQWLAREAGEAELSSVEERLKIYLMALWRMRSPIRRAVAHEEGAPAPRRASFDNGLIRMPESFHGIAGQSAELVYRACAAHISAHLVFGKGRFKRGSLRPMQVVLVSLIEDARVEHLAMRVFPGLAALWRPMHTATGERCHDRSRPDGASGPCAVRSRLRGPRCLGEQGARNVLRRARSLGGTPDQPHDWRAPRQRPRPDAHPAQCPYVRGRAGLSRRRPGAVGSGLASQRAAAHGAGDHHGVRAQSSGCPKTRGRETLRSRWSSWRRTKASRWRAIRSGTTRSDAIGRSGPRFWTSPRVQARSM